jgi:hypothetical protein
VGQAEDGAVYSLNFQDVGPELVVFDETASGLLDQEDSTAALPVYENRWAAPRTC